MSSRYRILLARDSHLAAIPSIEQAAASMFSEDDLPAAIRYLVTDTETLNCALGRGHIWVATDHRDHAVGFAMAAVIDGQAHLDEMDVLPRHGRRGIGTRLLRTVMAWAASTEHELLTLITFRHVAWNAPFYARHGFEAVTATELGPQMRSVLDQERAAGIRTENRQVMRISLK